MVGPALEWIVDFVRYLTGMHNVMDGSTCRIAKRFPGAHDYPVIKGGDGDPEHFYTYTCWACKKEFEI